MNDLMAIKKVASFETLLSAYAKANGGRNDFDAIDGGAGKGSTARGMLKHLSPSSIVYAFEPFPGNYRFFKPEETQIIFIKKALAETGKRMTFRVPSVVLENSVWGKNGGVGYSSVGYLTNGAPSSEKDIQVDCVSADSEIPASSNIGFIKLDLQGGELNALRGMGRILGSTKLMWVEFTNQPGLLDFLAYSDFIVFDTEYFILGEKNETSLAVFELTKSDVALSTGKKAWFGFRKYAWKNFEQEFSKARIELKMVQTDLVCVNKKYLQEFINALSYL
jgi:FkbM family methyltransferase